MNDILDLWLKEGIEERGNQSQNSFQKWIVPLVGGGLRASARPKKRELDVVTAERPTNMTLLTEDSNGFLLIESTSWGDLRGGST